MSRSAAAHRYHPGVEAFAGKQACQIARDRRLSHPLPGTYYGQRGFGRDGAEVRGPQFEVAAEVARPGVEGERGDFHPLFVADHGLVGEVDDDLHLVLGEGQPYGGDGIPFPDQRDAVVGAVLDLLGPAEEGSGDAFGSYRFLYASHRVEYDGRVVLAVDQEQGPHVPLAHRPAPAWAALALNLLVVLVLVGRRVEVHDQLPVLERVLAEDPNLAVLDLYDVVAGARVAPEARARGGPCVDDEHVLEPPRVGHVLVAREDEVDLGVG